MASASDIKQYFKRWPRFYYMIMVVFGPVLFTGLSPKAFLRRYPTTGKILNLGSGPRRIGPHVVNIDISSYQGVDLVADVCSVPLPSGSVDRIISDNVLEHVREAEMAVSEMHRLLSPGGLIYAAIPFYYPYHVSPDDYRRWTKQGLQELFAEFEIIEIGVRGGPFSALVTYLCHLTGILLSFGWRPLNSLFTNLAMFIFFPIKYIDIIFAHWPGVQDVAAVLYCVVRKK